MMAVVMRGVFHPCVTLPPAGFPGRPKCPSESFCVPIVLTWSDG